MQGIFVLLILAAGAPARAEDPPGAHEVSQPTLTACDARVNVNEPGTYCSDNAACSLGHETRYRFDFGDGELSSWTPSAPAGEPACESHTWTFWGQVLVRVQAHCAQDPAAMTGWSEGKLVTIRCPYCEEANSGGDGGGSPEGGGSGCFIQAVSRN